MVTKTVEKITELHQKLTKHLNGVKSGVAGRLLYYEEGIFILGLHATSPEKTQEATEIFWDSLPGDLREELKEFNIGFAGKQI